LLSAKTAKVATLFFVISQNSKSGGKVCKVKSLSSYKVQTTTRLYFITLQT